MTAWSLHSFLWVLSYLTAKKGTVVNSHGIWVWSLNNWKEGGSDVGVLSPYSSWGQPGQMPKAPYCLQKGLLHLEEISYRFTLNTGAMCSRHVASTQAWGGWVHILCQPTYDAIMLACLIGLRIRWHTAGTEGRDLRGIKPGRNEGGGRSESGVRHPTMTCIEWVSANRWYQSWTFSI